MNIFLTLIAQIISLFHKRKENRQKILKEFVEPAIEALDKIHSDYLESFQIYRNIADDPSKTIIDFIKTIHDDALFSMNLRAKLSAFEDHKDDKLLGSFITSLLEYLGGENSYHMNIYANSYRAGLLLTAADMIKVYRPLGGDRQKREMESIQRVINHIQQENSVNNEIARDFFRLQPEKRKEFHSGLILHYEIPDDIVDSINKNDLEEFWRKRVNIMINEKVEIIQKRYGSVQKQFVQLKHSLLSSL